MARKVPGWVWGCGIGCGVLLVGAIAVGLGGFLFIRGIVEDFEGVDAVGEEVAARFGSVDEFVPWPDGAIPEDRIEAFLEIRRLTGTARGDLQTSLGTLAEAEEGGWNLSKGIRTLKAGFGFINLIARYLGARNDAMISAGLGPGEYAYIYVVAYYSWLGKSPADGPPFVLSGDGDDDGRRMSPEEVREVRMERTRERLNDVFRPMLRRQLAAAESRAGESLPEGWLEALRSEVAAMEADAARLPWDDGLPGIVDGSLEPFRSELEASYSALCNPLEAHIHGD